MSDKKTKVEADDASTFTSPLTKDKAVKKATGIGTESAAAESAAKSAAKSPLETAAESAQESTADSDGELQTSAVPERKPKATDNIHVAKVQTSNTQVNNPLHGIKLQTIVEDLEAEYGWEGLAYRINIKCFKSDPSVKSSLKFLRKTPWARDKVERLFLKTFHKKYRPESY